LLFNRFFPIVDTCFSCEDIARQSCATVRRWQFFWQIFASYIFSKLCVQHISDMHSKFALPHDFVILAWLREATRQISTGFASWLRYCTDVAQRRLNKLCTMFGSLMCWYTMYIHDTLSGALALQRNFVRCNIHFASKSCVLRYWQHSCKTLEQWGQPNFVAFSTYIRQGGHHSEHRPTL